MFPLTTYGAFRRVILSTVPFETGAEAAKFGKRLAAIAVRDFRLERVTNPAGRTLFVRRMKTDNFVRRPNRVDRQFLIV